MMIKYLKIILVLLSTILSSSASVDNSLAIVPWEAPKTRPIPISPDLNEVKLLERVPDYLMQKSLNAQFSDLRLVDDLFMAFDITGQRCLEWELTRFLEAERLAKGYKSTDDVINPYFFHVTKDDKSFFLLGSCHCVTFQTLPSEVQNIILNCTAFVTERGPITNEEGAEYKNLIEIYRKYYDSTETWFDDLTDWEQKYLDALFSCCYPGLIPTNVDSETQELLKELNLKEPFVRNIKFSELSSVLWGAFMIDGMDICMENYFVDSSRTVKFLELPEETRNGQFSRLTPQENFSEVRKVLDPFLEGSGFLLSKEILGEIKLYLLGRKGSPEDDSFDFYNALKNNLLWYPRVMKLAEEALPDKMLITIGADHLGERSGVLYRLLTEGGYTANRYNSRDVWVSVTPSDLL